MRMSLITAPLAFYVTHRTIGFLSEIYIFNRNFPLFFLVGFAIITSLGRHGGRLRVNENHSQLENTMTDYTKEMLSAMEQAAPLSLDAVNALIANNKEFATVSKQSIIAKAKANGIEYIAKAPAAKRAKGATKTQLVDAIAKKTNAKLIGLEKATAQSLANLLDSLSGS